jgi:hypothetical protein
MPGMREQLKQAKDIYELEKIWHEVMFRARTGTLSIKAQRRCKKVWEEKSRGFQK